MDLKEIVKAQIVFDIQDECPNIDPEYIQKIQWILDHRMMGCYMEKPGTEIVLGSMYEQIKIYIANKCVSGLSPLSIKEYCYKLNSFNEYMHKPANMVTADDIKGYMMYLMLEKRLAKATVSNTIAVIKNFFFFLFNEKLIDDNPAVNIVRVKVPRKSPTRKPLSSEELEALRSTCKNINEKAILEFLYSTGCRIGELENIDIRSIDWESRKVDVLGKGSIVRTVFFSVRCKRYLMEYLRTRRGDSNILFVSQRAPYQPLKRDSMRAVIKRIAKRAQLSVNVFPHIIRHTFATNALNTGVDVTIIQKLLGHASIDTTMIYADQSYASIEYNYNKLLG